MKPEESLDKRRCSTSCTKPEITAGMLLCGVHTFCGYNVCFEVSAKEGSELCFDGRATKAFGEIKKDIISLI